MRWLLRSKIHNARITDADPHYVGSITIDLTLMEQAGIWAGERVLVVSNDTGERLETYVIPGAPGSGAIEMNGAAALKMKKGEQVIIMGFELRDEPLDARIVLVDDQNRFANYL